MSIIFLSHTKADKPIVEPIALHLAEVFGQENIFYDSWSIQPGDGIIDKMNEALSSCKFFFFFASNKSLDSNIVKLEWQNAIMKATKGETKIIPVKMDNCMMPAVMLQTLYIDFFGLGPEIALRQMIDVIMGRNIYGYGKFTGFQNVRGYIRWYDRKLEIEFRAEAYMEPHSRFLVLLGNEKDELTWKAPGETLYESGFNPEALTENGIIVNALLIARSSPTTPGFPFVVELTPKGESKIKLRGLMHQVSREVFKSIPVIEL